MPRSTPIAITLRPSHTHTTSGIPITIPLVNETRELGELMKPVPPTSELTAPLTIPFIAKVMTIGDIPNALTPSPLSTPTPMLAASATAMATGKPVEGAIELVMIAAIVIVHGTAGRPRRRAARRSARWRASRAPMPGKDELLGVRDAEEPRRGNARCHVQQDRQ